MLVNPNSESFQRRTFAVALFADFCKALARSSIYLIVLLRALGAVAVALGLFLALGLGFANLRVTIDESASVRVAASALRGTEMKVEEGKHFYERPKEK